MRLAWPQSPFREQSRTRAAGTEPADAMGKMRATAPPTIETTDDIRKGVSRLRRACPVLRAMHDRNGDPPLRRHEPGFAGLARIVVGQQLSIASAAAIWSRLADDLQGVTPARLLAASRDRLRSAGLSAAKIETLGALARAVESGHLDLPALQTAADSEVRRALVSIHGIGPWTADIYVMFCLGRTDAWAEGDLALQVGVARAFDLGARMRPGELAKLAERWRPWRSVAARLIWDDYAHLRGAAAPQNARSRLRPVSKTR